MTTTNRGSPRPEPFLAAAAKAMGMDTLRIIDTGLDPVTAEREQWDDGNNTLAIAPRLCVAYERNVETNAHLERAGIEVIRIRGSELGPGGAARAACPARSNAPPLANNPHGGSEAAEPRERSERQLARASAISGA